MLNDRQFKRELAKWGKDMSKPIAADIGEYLLEVAKEHGDGTILYDPKTKSYCLLERAPKHLRKRAKRDRGLFVVQTA